MNLRYGFWSRGVFALMLAGGLVGCEDEDKGEDTGDGDDDGGTDTGTPADDGMGSTGDPGDSGGPPMWVVGEEGEMLRWDRDGAVDRYPLDVTEDFTDIACRGLAQAWVVGEGGTLLSTDDAGETWTVIELPTVADLHAVAASDGGRIFVAGAGVAFVSDDVGLSWAALSVPAATYTSVTADLDGSDAWLTTAGGAIWHVTADEATEVFRGGPALHDVSVSSNGSVVVAVGDEGSVLRSDDAGATFVSLAVPTSRSLDTVQIARDGGLTLAAGEAGVLVRIDFDSGVTAQELLDARLTLHAVHVDAQGHGQAIGDAGVALATEDAGLTWEPVELGTELDLYGIDHPGALHL